MSETTGYMPPPPRIEHYLETEMSDRKGWFRFIRQPIRSFCAAMVFVAVVAAVVVGVVLRPAPSPEETVIDFDGPEALVATGEELYFALLAESVRSVVLVQVVVATRHMLVYGNKSLTGEPGTKLEINEFGIRAPEGTSLVIRDTELYRDADYENPELNVNTGAEMVLVNVTLSGWNRVVAVHGSALQVSQCVFHDEINVNVQDQDLETSSCENELHLYNTRARGRYFPILWRNGSIVVQDSVEYVGQDGEGSRFVLPAALDFRLTSPSPFGAVDLFDASFVMTSASSKFEVSNVNFVGTVTNTFHITAGDLDVVNCRFENTVDTALVASGALSHVNLFVTSFIETGVNVMDGCGAIRLDTSVDFRSEALFTSRTLHRKCFGDSVKNISGVDVTVASLDDAIANLEAEGPPGLETLHYIQEDSNGLQSIPPSQGLNNNGTREFAVHLTLAGATQTRRRLERLEAGPSYVNFTEANRVVTVQNLTSTYEDTSFTLPVTQVPALIYLEHTLDDEGDTCISEVSVTVDGNVLQVLPASLFAACFDTCVLQDEFSQCDSLYPNVVYDESRGCLLLSANKTLSVGFALDLNQAWCNRTLNVSNFFFPDVFELQVEVAGNLDVSISSGSAVGIAHASFASNSSTPKLSSSKLEGLILAPTAFELTGEACLKSVQLTRYGTEVHAVPLEELIACHSGCKRVFDERLGCVHVGANFYSRLEIDMAQDGCNRFKVQGNDPSLCAFHGTIATLDELVNISASLNQNVYSSATVEVQGDLVGSALGAAKTIVRIAPNRALVVAANTSQSDFPSRNSTRSRSRLANIHFHVEGGAALEIDGLEVVSGRVVNAFGNVEATDCSFVDCDTEDNGGCIRTAGGRVLLQDTSFVNSTSLGDGGAVHADDVAVVEIVACLFHNSKSSGKGNSIFNGLSSSMFIDGCRFTDAFAIHNEGGQMDIDQVFIENDLPLLTFDSSNVVLDGPQFNDRILESRQELEAYMCTGELSHFAAQYNDTLLQCRERCLRDETCRVMAYDLDQDSCQVCAHFSCLFSCAGNMSFHEVVPQYRFIELQGECPTLTALQSTVDVGLAGVAMSYEVCKKWCAYYNSCNMFSYNTLSNTCALMATPAVRECGANSDRVALAYRSAPATHTLVSKEGCFVDGVVLSEFTKVAVEQCDAICFAQKDCRGFAFDETKFLSTCYLHSSPRFASGMSAPCDNITLSIYVDAEDRFPAGRYIPLGSMELPFGVSTTNADSLDVCQRRCDAQYLCIAVAFDATAARCAHLTRDTTHKMLKESAGSYTFEISVESLGFSLVEVELEDLPPLCEINDVQSQTGDGTGISTSSDTLLIEECQAICYSQVGCLALLFATSESAFTSCHIYADATACSSPVVPNIGFEGSEQNLYVRTGTKPAVEPYVVSGVVPEATRRLLSDLPTFDVLASERRVLKSEVLGEECLATRAVSSVVKSWPLAQGLDTCKLLCDIDPECMALVLLGTDCYLKRFIVVHHGVSPSDEPYCEAYDAFLIAADIIQTDSNFHQIPPGLCLDAEPVLNDSIVHTLEPRGCERACLRQGGACKAFKQQDATCELYADLVLAPCVGSEDGWTTFGAYADFILFEVDSNLTGGGGGGGGGGGELILEADVPSRIDCAGLCFSYDACRAIVYNRSSEVCMLYSECTSDNCQVLIDPYDYLHVRDFCSSANDTSENAFVLPNVPHVEHCIAYCDALVGDCVGIRYSAVRLECELLASSWTSLQRCDGEGTRNYTALVYLKPRSPAVPYDPLPESVCPIGSSKRTALTDSAVGCYTQVCLKSLTGDTCVGFSHNPVTRLCAVFTTDELEGVQHYTNENCEEGNHYSVRSFRFATNGTTSRVNNSEVSLLDAITVDNAVLCASLCATYADCEALQFRPATKQCELFDAQRSLARTNDTNIVYFETFNAHKSFYIGENVQFEAEPIASFEAKRDECLRYCTTWAETCAAIAFTAPRGCKLFGVAYFRANGALSTTNEEAWISYQPQWEYSRFPDVPRVTHVEGFDLSAGESMEGVAEVVLHTLGSSGRLKRQQLILEGSYSPFMIDVDTPSNTVDGYLGVSKMTVYFYACDIELRRYHHGGSSGSYGAVGCAGLEALTTEEMGYCGRHLQNQSVGYGGIAPNFYEIIPFSLDCFESGSAQSYTGGARQVSSGNQWVWRAERGRSLFLQMGLGFSHGAWDFIPPYKWWPTRDHIGYDAFVLEEFRHVCFGPTPYTVMHESIFHAFNWIGRCDESQFAMYLTMEIIHNASGLCLGVAKDEAILHDCTGNSTDAWIYTDEDRLMNMETHKCLDRVAMVDCEDAETWRWRPNGVIQSTDTLRLLVTRSYTTGNESLVVVQSTPASASLSLQTQDLFFVPDYMPDSHKKRIYGFDEKGCELECFATPNCTMYVWHEAVERCFLVTRNGTGLQFGAGLTSSMASVLTAPTVHIVKRNLPYEVVEGPLQCFRPDEQVQSVDSLPTLVHCFALCDAFRECSALRFDEQLRCTVYTTVPSQMCNNETSSNGGTWVHRTRYPEHTTWFGRTERVVGETSGSSLDDCVVLCENMPECTAFEYEVASGRCIQNSRETVSLMLAVNHSTGPKLLSCPSAASNANCTFAESPVQQVVFTYDFANKVIQYPLPGDAEGNCVGVFIDGFIGDPQYPGVMPIGVVKCSLLNEFGTPYLAYWGNVGKDIDLFNTTIDHVAHCIGKEGSLNFPVARPCETSSFDPHLRAATCDNGGECSILPSRKMYVSAQGLDSTIRDPAIQFTLFSFTAAGVNTRRIFSVIANMERVASRVLKQLTGISASFGDAVNTAYLVLLPVQIAQDTTDRADDIVTPVTAIVNIAKKVKYVGPLIKSIKLPSVMATTKGLLKSNEKRLERLVRAVEKVLNPMGKLDGLLLASIAIVAGFAEGDAWRKIVRVIANGQKCAVEQEAVEISTNFATALGQLENGLAEVTERLLGVERTLNTLAKTMDGFTTTFKAEITNPFKGFSSSLRGVDSFLRKIAPLINALNIHLFCLPEISFTWDKFYIRFSRVWRVLPDVGIRYPRPRIQGKLCIPVLGICHVINGVIDGVGRLLRWFGVDVSGLKNRIRRFINDALNLILSALPFIGDAVRLEIDWGKCLGCLNFGGDGGKCYRLFDVFEPIERVENIVRKLFFPLLGFLMEKVENFVINAIFGWFPELEIPIPELLLNLEIFDVYTDLFDNLYEDLFRGLLEPFEKLAALLLDDVQDAIPDTFDLPCDLGAEVLARTEMAVGVTADNTTVDEEQPLDVVIAEVAKRGVRILNPRMFVRLLRGLVPSITIVPSRLVKIVATELSVGVFEKAFGRNSTRSRQNGRNLKQSSASSVRKVDRDKSRGNQTSRLLENVDGRIIVTLESTHVTASRSNTGSRRALARTLPFLKWVGVRYTVPDFLGNRNSRFLVLASSTSAYDTTNREYNIDEQCCVVTGELFSLDSVDQRTEQKFLSAIWYSDPQNAQNGPSVHDISHFEHKFKLFHMDINRPLAAKYVMSTATANTNSDCFAKETSSQAAARRYFRFPTDDLCSCVQSRDTCAKNDLKTKLGELVVDYHEIKVSRRVVRPKRGVQAVVNFHRTDGNVIPDQIALTNMLERAYFLALESTEKLLSAMDTYSWSDVNSNSENDRKIARLLAVMFELAPTSSGTRCFAKVTQEKYDAHVVQIQEELIDTLSFLERGHFEIRDIERSPNPALGRGVVHPAELDNVGLSLRDNIERKLCLQDNALWRHEFQLANTQHVDWCTVFGAAGTLIHESVHLRNLRLQGNSSLPFYGAPDFKYLTFLEQGKTFKDVQGWLKNTAVLDASRLEKLESAMVKREVEMQRTNPIPRGHVRQTGGHDSFMESHGAATSYGRAARLCENGRPHVRCTSEASSPQAYRQSDIQRLHQSEASCAVHHLKNNPDSYARMVQYFKSLQILESNQKLTTISERRDPLVN